MMYFIRQYKIVVSSCDIKSLQFQGWDELQCFESGQEFLVIYKTHFDFFFFCLSNSCNVICYPLQK